jgi:hypothetical protein
MQDSNELTISMSDDKKIEILLKALEERYNSIHIIRERVQNICLWILGLFITAAGWLLQSNHSLLTKEKIFFSLMILISVFVIRVFYLNDLEKGFKTQQKIQAKIEEVFRIMQKRRFYFKFYIS